MSIRQTTGLEGKEYVMRNGKISLVWINKCLFCITFMLKTYTDVFYVAQNKSGLIVFTKYLTLLMGIVVSFVILNRRINPQIVFNKEFNSILLVAIVFFIASLFRSIITMSFLTDSIVGIMYIVLAIIYAYYILNTLSFDDIYSCMKIILISGVIGYICEIGLNNFNVENILKSSIQDSYSPFESNYTSSLSIIMCSFFAYYRREKKWLIISTVFALFTFKRSYMLFAFIYLIMPIVFDLNKKVSKYIYLVTAVAFVLATFGIIWLYMPENETVFIEYFGTTASKFSSGRSDLLRALINNGYISTGYESSTTFLGRGLEMELVKIYLELGIVSLIFFVFNYLKISKGNGFCFLIMFQNMINFLTSHSLSSAFNWSLRFIIIGCILYKEKNYIKNICFLKTHDKMKE